MPTAVVNIHRMLGVEESPRFVDIRRPSKWSNPFYIRPDQGMTRRICLYRFCVYLDENPRLVAQAREELVDKILGCVCKPLDCHGDVWADLVHGLDLREIRRRYARD